MHYSDQQLNQFLEEVDSNQPESDLSNANLGHLEECESCRSRLSKLAGDGPWLEDWMDSVGDDTAQFDVNQFSDSSASVVIAVEPSDAMHSHLQCESVQLDFLERPAHPELLGRLGRYDIERLVGTGGFGIVFKARDSELNRVVAIKVLAPHLMNSGPARQRFAREAQASAAVVHDHVVPIYDVVVNEKTCYFVMQYIAGESLQERVDRLGPLSTEDILQIGAQMAAGLEAAHEQGLIHRDVKPGNVLLEDTVNRVMISDFGLARAADDASITRSGAITGTPHYMSPEQARGLSVDFRSDLFSLGSVIYFMCTGRSPFRAPQMMAVLNRVCHEDYRSVEEINSKIPYELTKVIDRLLDKDPNNRHATAKEVHDELQQLLSEFQSGKLRPRRFIPPRAWLKRLDVAKVSSLLGLLALVSVALLPGVRSRLNNAFSVGSSLNSVVDAPSSPTRVAKGTETSLFDRSDSNSNYIPRGLGVAGSFVGNAIRHEVDSALTALEEIETNSFGYRPTHSYGHNWDGELAAVSSIVGAWEQELAADELAIGTTASEVCAICGSPKSECHVSMPSNETDELTSPSESKQKSESTIIEKEQ